VNGQESFIERRIELNWSTLGDPEPTDEIILTIGHPVDDPASAIVANFLATDHPSGSILTNVQMPRNDYTMGEVETWAQKRCLGNHYGAYVRNGEPILVSCLSSQPTWMEDNAGILGQIPIRNLLIPGTHDTGAFSEYKGAESENFLLKYVITQEETLLAQLAHGIRYFDLRLAYFPDEAFPLWLNHGLAKVHPFNDSMEEVVHFVANTNEVVIMDFHGFPVGFDGPEADERHQILIDYVVENVGQWMVPRNVGYDVTLNDLWNSGDFFDPTVRWSNFDRWDPKMGVFLQSTEATPCGHFLK
jgi:hypothetical protein